MMRNAAARQMLREYRPMRGPWTTFVDWIMLHWLKSRRFCYVDQDYKQHPGRITRLWTSPFESPWFQRGHRYAFIRFDDGVDDMLSCTQLFYFNDELQRYEHS